MFVVWVRGGRRYVRGPAVCLLPQAAAGVRYAGHEGQRPSSHSTPHRVLLLVAGSAGEVDPDLHAQELSQRHRTHSAGTRLLSLSVCVTGVSMGSISL